MYLRRRVLKRQGGMRVGCETVTERVSNDRAFRLSRQGKGEPIEISARPLYFSRRLSTCYHAAPCTVCASQAKQADRSYSGIPSLERWVCMQATLKQKEGLVGKERRQWQPGRKKYPCGRACATGLLLPSPLPHRGWPLCACRALPLRAYGVLADDCAAAAAHTPTRPHGPQQTHLGH